MSQLARVTRAIVPLALALTLTAGSAAGLAHADDDTVATVSPAPLLLLVEPADATDPSSAVSTADASIHIAGQARPGAVISVDGDLADQADDGSFAADVTLDDGLNAVEVVATDPDTEEEARLTVLVVRSL